MRRNAALALLFTGAVGGVGLVVSFDGAPRSDAQAPIPRDNALVDMAPGTPNLVSATACDDTGTSFFKYDNLGSAFAVADVLPIPDGASGVVHNEAGGGVATCAWVDDVTAVIGVQAAIGTRFQVDGVDQPSSFTVGAGDHVPSRANAKARSTNASYYTGVCNEPSTHDEASDVDVYLPCANDADCASIAGNSANATCETADPDSILTRPVNSSVRRVRGQYLACRCRSASVLNFNAQR